MELIDDPNVRAEYRKRILRSVFSVTFYMITSIALVFLNRLCMSSTEKAGALFLSWYQFVVAYIIILLISAFGQNVPLLNLFPRIHYDVKVMVKVIPVTATFLLMIAANNKCLEYVSISAYQIVRSLTILFNIALSYVILHIKTSPKAILACLGVVIGFFFGVTGEFNLSIRGAIYGVCSSLFVAMYSIVVKRAIKLLDDNQYILIEYNTPIAALLLTPFVAYSGEFNVFFEHRSTKFWILQTTAGIVGFVINIATFLNIKYTTPLTHNLSGTVKACLQTLLALWLFPKTETITVKKLLGTVMIIGFSALYSWIKKNEVKDQVVQENKDVEDREDTQFLTKDEKGENSKV